MHRPQRVLVGIDLHHGDRIASRDISPAADAAITQATELALASGAAITLAAVLEITEEAFQLIEMDVTNANKTVEDVALAALNGIAERVRAQGVKVETAIRFGTGWEELTRLAIAGKFDVVLVGTRERGATARLLFGSTAQKLIRYCPTPVWICKPGELREVREILVASDFSEAALAATHAAVAVAQAISAKLFVAHALEFPFEAYLRTAGVTEEDVAKYRAKMHEEARQNLQQQLAQTDYRTLTYGAKIELPEGPPDTVLPLLIEEHEIDLLVIGTHGRSGFTGALLGNTAERLLPHLHCSLLAIKPAGFVSPVSIA